MKHLYVSDAGVLEVDREQLLALRELSIEASGPGKAVSVSDLLQRALAAYLGEQREKLAAIYEQARIDELERVLTTHGGGDAA